MMSVRTWNRKYGDILYTLLFKSDLTDKIKWDFFQAVSVLLYGCTT